MSQLRSEHNRSLLHPFCCEVLYMWSKRELIDKQARFWVLMAQGWTLQRPVMLSAWIDELAGVGGKRLAGGSRARSPNPRGDTCLWRSDCRSRTCTWPGTSEVRALRGAEARRAARPAAQGE